MSLVRAWMRQITGASGAALLVPAAIFGSMVLLALAGGFGQLGGLGQAFAGPATPSVARSATALAPKGGAGSRAAALLPVVAGTPKPTLLASVVGPAAAARGGGAPGAGTGRRPGETGSGGTVPRRPTGPGGTTPTSPPTTPPPGPPPTLIDQVVSLGTAVTSRIPGPVGQLATSVLKNVGQTVDRVLPGNSRPGQGALGGSVTALQTGVSQLGSGVHRLLPGVQEP